jgi:uncharacterized membrane protein (UPF0127 family)
MPDQKVAFSYKGRKITVKAKVCETGFSKCWGKMFSFSKKPLLFVFDREQEIAIHMAFVFMPLLVAWLDKNKKPVKIREMRPFTSFDSAKAIYVVEIPL